MASRFLRHSSGTLASPRLRGTRFISPRASSLLLGMTLAAGALLVAPQTHYAWAAPTVGGDENGPKVQIVSPVTQDVLKGRARILVGIKVTQYNPSTIQLFLDGKPASDLLSLSSFASSTFDWETRQTADGPHKLTVRVTDTAGFRGWAEVNVYVNNQNVRDTVAPTLKWNSVQKYQEISGKTRIQLDAKDNFGVKWIIVSLNPLAQATKQPAKYSWILSEAPYGFDLDSTKVADGLYALSARAWDSMEQEGQSPTLTVGVVNGNVGNGTVNATTVHESLEVMRAADKASQPTEKSQPPKPAPVYVEPPTVTTPSDNYSGGIKPQTNTGSQQPGTPSGGVKPQGNAGNGQPSHTLRPTQPTIDGSTPPVEVAEGDKNVTTPALSRRPLDVAPPATTASVAPTTNTGDGVRVAKVTSPEMKARIETAPATLSAKETKRSGDVLAPALSSGAQTPTGEVKGNDPARIARLDTPEIKSRVGTDAVSAILSQHTADVTGALAPARTPELGVAGAPEGTRIARLATPEEKSRSLEVTPILSSDGTSLALNHVVEATPGVAPAVKITSPSLKVSNPAQRRPYKPSNTYLRKQYEVRTHVVNTVEPKTPTKGNGMVIAQGNEPVFPSMPQMSQSSTPTINEGVVTMPKGVPTAKPRTEIAALPRTGSADGNSVEVAPSATLIHPVITVSPVQVALNKSLPEFYQARHNTTLRAVAAHFGLPVELVASANNWTSDMKILQGMKVQLPRQVQLSYNGQKVRGDVASLMAGDKSFTAMRFLFEHTGGTISWDAAKREVVARKGNSTIRVQIGSKTATVNNKEVMMQLAAFLFEGRTMVPARFFEEGLDAHVEWNPETGRVVIAMAG